MDSWPLKDWHASCQFTFSQDPRAFSQRWRRNIPAIAPTARGRSLAPRNVAMKILLCISLVLPLFPQAGLKQNPSADQPPSDQQASRSVTQPKPGGQAIKEKGLYDSTGYLHPFRRMPKYILSDQAAIWTSPFTSYPWIVRRAP
jgi:hypothetical protein